jgi:hypothetical protein
MYRRRENMTYWVVPGDKNYETETAVWIGPVSYHVFEKPAGRDLGQFLSL